MGIGLDWYPKICGMEMRYMTVIHTFSDFHLRRCNMAKTIGWFFHVAGSTGILGVCRYIFCIWGYWRDDML